METIFCEACHFEAQVRVDGAPVCEDCRDRLMNENITIEELQKRLRWEAEMHEADMRREYMDIDLRFTIWE